MATAEIQTAAAATLPTTLPKPPSSDRWYLCKESSEKLNHWICKESKGAMITHLEPNTVVAPIAKCNVGAANMVYHEPRTIAVQISKWSPRVADMVHINNALRPTFSIEK